MVDRRAGISLGQPEHFPRLISIGLADYILPPAAVPTELVACASGPYRSGETSGQGTAGAGLEEPWSMTTTPAVTGAKTRKKLNPQSRIEIFRTEICAILALAIFP